MINVGKVDMGLFFKETIFLKDDCNLKNEIDELLNLKGKVTNENELDKQIKLLKAGINGEEAIEYELKNARIGMYVLRDVNINVNESSAQIDYVVITSVHAYLIECKNMIGDITIDNNGQFIRKLPWGNKESIYSPVTQAQRHVDIMKKYRDANRSSILNALNSLIGEDDYYKPLVVVANTNGIINMKYATREIKNIVVKVDNLINYLTNDINKAKLLKRDSKEIMEKTAKYILSANTPKEKENWTNRFELKKEYSNTFKKQIMPNDSLEIELRAYRTKKSKEMKRKAYYIFTNAELEKLINIRPKTKAELNSILNCVKIDIYGEDILRIINR